MNLEQGWPLVLSTEAEVPSQTTQRPPQLALMNPTGEPFKIHEIRFSLKNSDSTVSVTGAVIGCKLDLGSVAISNGFVPVWNFGRVISTDQDLNSEYSWRLAHPIIVPAGGILSPNFQHFGQVSTTVTARITYFATAITDPRRATPQRIFLPWISSYTGKVFSYSAEDSDTSRETDLLNPFDSDLRISRLIGRFNFFGATLSNNTSRFGAHLMDVRVAMSNGDPLVRTPTPFAQVFAQDGRAWEQRNTILKPKQFFQVFVDKLAVADVTANAADSTIQPYVSIVGYRELQTSGSVA